MVASGGCVEGTDASRRGHRIAQVEFQCRMHLGAGIGAVGRSHCALVCVDAQGDPQTFSRAEIDLRCLTRLHTASPGEAPGLGKQEGQSEQRQRHQDEQNDDEGSAAADHGGGGLSLSWEREMEPVVESISTVA